MSAVTFERVERRTVPVEIRERVVEAIRAGHFPPGAPLPAERVLCEEFGVARTSVREAIQGLITAGYLERRGNRSVVVERLPAVRFEADDRKILVSQLFEVRKVIEPAIAELATTRASDDERAEIAELAAQDPPNLDEFRAIDRQFHAALARACGNPLLTEVHAKLLAALVRLRRVRLVAVRRVQPGRGAPADRVGRRRPPGDRRGHRQRRQQGRRRGVGEPPRGCRAANGGAPAVSAPEADSRYCYFLDEDQFIETDRPGFRRRVIVGDALELWFWRIDGGAEGSFLHRHEENEQLGIIMRGTLDFRIGEAEDDTRKVLNAGDVYLAPRSIWHGDSVFIGDDEYGEVWILDVFAPPRTAAPGAAR